LAQAALTIRTSGSSSVEVRLGFVPLLDAAPLIVADARGYFREEGLAVVLDRQIGWGNVRDKLVYGHLDASHALVGMPPCSLLGREHFSEPLIGIMGLGSGGSAISLSRKLIEAGVTTAADLSLHLGTRPPRRPVLAHVFGCSTHHYLLREWLAAGGMDPDRDVQLVVLPPPQVARQLEQGCVDGCCVGEPWNSAIEAAGTGGVVAATTDLVPGHPEKVLAVTRRWLDGHRGAAEALVRAVLRACAFCESEEGREQLPEILSPPQYLDTSTETLLRSVTRRTPRWSCAPQHTFPSANHVSWFLDQMIRWSHLPPEADVPTAARESLHPETYRAAAQAIGVPCPAQDLPPLAAAAEREKWITVRTQARRRTAAAAEPAATAHLQGARSE
jgi:ABC-type nitrate/sulfonate/bicarbonate transport system substrate-binding protein